MFVDTNVLFPFSVMDMMLALTEDDVHEVLWSQALLAEWQRVIVREQRRSIRSAAAVTAAIREYFAESEVVESQYISLVAEMPGNDPDDRLHMAAAIAGGAQTLVTWNLVDFPGRSLTSWGLRVCDPDTYLLELLDSWPDEVVNTLVRLAGEKRRPPRTPTELAGMLGKAGVPGFAERVAAQLAGTGR